MAMSSTTASAALRRVPSIVRQRGLCSKPVARISPTALPRPMAVAAGALWLGAVSAIVAQEWLADRTPVYSLKDRAELSQFEMDLVDAGLAVDIIYPTEKGSQSVALGCKKGSNFLTMPLIKGISIKIYYVGDAGLPQDAVAKIVSQAVGLFEASSPVQAPESVVLLGA